MIDGGGVRCWGHGGSGQLGYQAPPIPDEHNQDSTYATLVPGLTARAVVGGGFHTCALTSGALQCWGYNFFGQLGGYDPQVESPKTVTAVRGVASVAVATHAACALVSEIPRR